MPPLFLPAIHPSHITIPPASFLFCFLVAPVRTAIVPFAGSTTMSNRIRSADKQMEKHKKITHPYSSSSGSSTPPPFLSPDESENERESEDILMLPPLAMWTNGEKKRVLSKQLSMRETKREVKWEKRKKQMHLRSLNGESEGKGSDVSNENKDKRQRRRSLTDEDLDELRGSIELGFGFNEENGGHHLCKTLPALNLYFAVNRQLSDSKLRQSPSPASTPRTATMSSTSSISTSFETPSPRSPNDRPLQEKHGRYSVSSSDDTWQIFKPGDSPQHVKTRLRHWAQIVACSVKHSY